MTTQPAKSSRILTLPLLGFKAPLARQRLYTTNSGHLLTIQSALLGLKNYGSNLTQLEEEMSTLIGAKHCICVPQARVGIYLALREYIQPGQKVILSPYTIVDVINMVICAGGIPVFADIDQETCNISPTSIENLIDEKTGAVMITHFYGLACDMARIQQICTTNKIPLLEDAAQSFGSKIDNKWVGTIGDMGIFSFGMYKNITSYLGGMLVTDDTAIAKKISATLDTFPVQPTMPLLKKVLHSIATDIATSPIIFKNLTYWIFRFGYLNNIQAINNKTTIDSNPQIKREIPKSYLCKLSPLQAKLVQRQLGHLQAHTTKRIETAKLYHEQLSEIKELTLPPLRTDGTHVYSYFPIQYADRDKLVRYALRNGRDLTVSHHKNCASLSCFKEFNRDCSNAEVTSQSVIYLPTYPSYSQVEVYANISVIKKFFGRS